MANLVPHLNVDDARSRTIATRYSSDWSLCAMEVRGRYLHLGSSSQSHASDTCYGLRINMYFEKQGLLRLVVGGNTVISKVAILVQEQPLGPYMSCTIMLDNISGSESAIFYHKIHYFDGYFAHFFRARFGALF